MTVTKFTKAQQSAIDTAVAEQLAKHAEADRIGAEFTAAQEREAAAAKAAEPETEQSMFARAKEWVQGADSILMMLGMPSVSRNIVAFIAGALIAGGVSYACISSFIILGAACSITMGVGFIGYMLSFLAIAISTFVTIFTFGKVQTFILDGSIDRTFTKATGWVSGLFATKTIAS